jgi:hypothetical protein
LRHQVCAIALFFLSSLTAGSRASAQPEAPESGTEETAPEEAAAPEGAAEAEPEPESGKKKKKKKSDALEPQRGADGAADDVMASAIDVRGRVLARMAFEDDVLFEYRETKTEYSRRGLAFTIPDARASLRAKVLAWVTLTLEADFGQPRPSLKDGYIQAKKKRWMLRGGQFKMPISAFHLESPWTLPLARRGWLHELISDHMLLTGRRQGVMGQIKGGGYWDPALTVGAFQSVLWGRDAGRPFPLIGITEPTVVGRISITPGRLEIAAAAQRRVTNAGPLGKAEGFWAAGGDVTADFAFEKTGWRFWGEALVGSSWLDHDLIDPRAATFVTARVLAAWRLGGLSRGETYFEAFATIGALEPDADVVSDLFVEIMGGINVGHWRQTRLTLQFEWASTQKNFPDAQFFLGLGREPIKTHTAIVIQAGAAF